MELVLIISVSCWVICSVSSRACVPKQSGEPSLRLLIIGAPGAGKSYLSGKLREELNMTIISSGNILREEAKNDTEFGRSIRRLILSGKLVPDDIVTDLVALHLNNVGSNWVLDGFPRTLAQAEMLHNRLGDVDAVIHLDIPFTLIIERLANRLVHLPSGRTYNLLYRPPKVPGKDDETGESLTRRPDDDPEVVKTRLDVYENQSRPILDFYRKLGLVKAFGLNSTVDDMWPEVKLYLDELRKSKRPPRFRTLFDKRANHTCSD